jgi:hypothetical protein
MYLYLALMQEVPPEVPPPVLNVNELLAYAINTVLVFALVQVVKNAGPKLSPLLKQGLALAGGMVLMQFAGPALSQALGFPVDFGPLAAALAGLASGATAIAAFDLRNGG